jgi:dTDP-4-dehydrorhamnose 3,5-epimerase
VKIVETALEGVYIIEIEPVHDERGFFARAYCDRELSALLPHIVQSSISFNTHRGTLRGMHYQLAPYAEVKLMRCARGAVYDVVVDLRTGRCLGTELTRDNGRMLLVPEGFAQGFQTLEDATEVNYHVSREYHPEAGEGFRWNDPAFGLQWPLDVTVISERDRSWPDFSR